jgi:hypothetical protein
MPFLCLRWRSLPFLRDPRSNIATSCCQYDTTPAASGTAAGLWDIHLSGPVGGG